jgi:hypothetical protein
LELLFSIVGNEFGKNKYQINLIESKEYVLLENVDTSTYFCNVICFGKRNNIIMLKFKGGLTGNQMFSICYY